MSTLADNKTPLASEVAFRQGRMYVILTDGREVGVPLSWFPRLQHATEAQRKNNRLIGGGLGIHFPEIDEDVSVEGLLRA